MIPAELLLRPRSPEPRRVPSTDGLRLILSGMLYLLAIGGLQLAVAVATVAGSPSRLPANALDVRDVVALFGWVGMMICGVSVIIVPNHLRVRLRPSYLPRVHLVAANLGLVGYLATSLLVGSGAVADAFLAVVSLSYLAFALGTAVTVAPFLRHAPATARGRLPTRT